MPIAVHTSSPQPVGINRIVAQAQELEWCLRELLLKAIEVLGDEDKAQAWLKGANPSLEDRRPVDVAEASDHGYEEAYAVLGRIAYGISP